MSGISSEVEKLISNFSFAKIRFEFTISEAKKGNESGILWYHKYHKEYENAKKELEDKNSKHPEGSEVPRKELQKKIKL